MCESVRECVCVCVCVFTLDILEFIIFTDEFFLLCIDLCLHFLIIF